MRPKLGVRILLPVLMMLGVLCGIWFKGPGAKAAIPPTKVTVYDTIAGATLSINASDRKPATQFLTDGSIGSADLTDSLGNHQTVLYFNFLPIATTDNGTNGAQGSAIVYTFPEGLIYNKGDLLAGTISSAGSITATAAVVGALGSVAAGTESIGTLGSTKADFIPQITGTLTGSAGTLSGVTSTTALFDGTAAAKVVRLNYAIPDAGSSGAGTITIYGVATLNWAMLGDK